MWVCVDLISLFVVQLVSPGAWLSDLCQERYEVREKKASKKVLVFLSCFYFALTVWLIRKFTEEVLNTGFFPNWNTQNKKSSPNKVNRTIEPKNLFSFLFPQFSQPPKGGF